MLKIDLDSYISRKSLLPFKQPAAIVLAAFLSIQSIPALAGEPKPLPEAKKGTPATYTSLKRFPQNLGGNFLALFNKENAGPLFIGGVASAMIAPNDHYIRDRVSIPGESSIAGKVGSTVGGPAVIVPVVAGLLIGGRYSKDCRFHSFTYALAQASVINEGLIEGLKVAVGRTRPDGSDDRSFPSGHAANSFMIATIVQRYYGTTPAIIGYAAATFIAFSRGRDDKHWASDLSAGAAIGYIVGSSICRRTGISVKVGKITLVPAIDLKQRQFGIRSSLD